MSRNLYPVRLVRRSLRNPLSDKVELVIPLFQQECRQHWSAVLRSGGKLKKAATGRLSRTRDEANQRGKSDLPINHSSTARAHWRPSLMAQTTRL